MEQTLLNGSQFSSATQELKDAFQERKPFLPTGWIKIYLDRFCVNLSPSQVLIVSKHLYNINTDNTPQAPRLSVLKNIDILIEENNWSAEPAIKN